MQVRVLCIGKVKNKNLFSEIEELKKRISRFELIELKEIKDKNPDIVKKKEFDAISKYLNEGYYNILLWEFGTEFETKQFYDKLKKIDRPIQFIITGAYGPDYDLRNNVDLKLSLSKMTFTHEQALYMLTEQLYRVECFNKNIPYTK